MKYCKGVAHGTRRHYLDFGGDLESFLDCGSLSFWRRSDLGWRRGFLNIRRNSTNF